MFYIFDWDGTISDSTAKIVGCMRAATQEVGLPDLSNDDIKNIIGLGLPEAIMFLYPDISKVLLEKVQQAYSAFFTGADTTPSPFFTGAMETMAHLKNEGHYVAVATGKSRRGLDRVLNTLGMSDFFHASRCADETASKPNPKMLLELLNECAFEAGNAVMVGDTEYDMAMAKAIAMPRIAVSFGAHHIDRLKPYDPVLCVDEFSGILAWSNE